jgi:hypothetical protein
MTCEGAPTGKRGRERDRDGAPYPDRPQDENAVRDGAASDRQVKSLLRLFGLDWRVPNQKVAARLLAEVKSGAARLRGRLR